MLQAALGPGRSSTPWRAAFAGIWILLWCLLVPAGHAAGQSAFNPKDPQFALQPRRNSEGQVDRLEGLEPLQVVGERIALVSALLLADTVPAVPSPVTHRLTFSLDKAEEVRLKVRAYSVLQDYYLYWMLPDKRRYGRGRNEFVWNAQLTRDVGLKTDDLGAIAHLTGYSHPVVVPVLFHAMPTLPPNIRAAACQFVFVPTETLTVEYRIYPRGKRSLSYLTARAVGWPKDLQASIRWDTTDGHGQLASDGAYVLSLTATPALVGRTIEPLTLEYEFRFKRDVK